MLSRPIRALLSPLTAAAVAAAALAGCGGGGSGGRGSITLYSGQHAETTSALIAAFEHQTGIKVKVRHGDENALVQEIEQEGSRSPADAVYTENSPALMSLEGKGLLAALPPDVVASVPAKYSSPAGDWVGVSARASVLVYGTSKLAAAQVPASVLDLADPKWKGKLALAPTETDFQPVVTSIAKSRGDQAALAWLKAVKANAVGHIESDNEAVTADINNGQAVLGIVDHYYWYRMASNVGQASLHSAISYFAASDPGYVIDVSGAAVLKSSKHQAQAEELVRFLVSAAGQQGLVDSKSFEYPLRPGAPDPAGLKPLGDLQPAPTTVSDLGDGSLALRLLQEAQLV